MFLGSLTISVVPLTDSKSLPPRTVFWVRAAGTTSFEQFKIKAMC